ncbi:autophagy protein 17 [Tulasnella sp. 403]|nr:autophagy protein 17 [Tulasnella sp. 403]
MGDLVSLVVQSKKALQQAEAICSHTNTVSHYSSDLVLDVLAADAKIKWLSDGVLDQLNIWDNERNQRTQALDTILETLAQQLVPPTLHQVAYASSLFGSQHSAEGGNGNLPQSTRDPQGASRPTSQDTVPPDGGFLRTQQEIRKLKDPEVLNDQTKWKSLRDFVDEKGIEDAMDVMDADRHALEQLISRTATYPDSIMSSVANIQATVLAAFDGIPPQPLSPPTSTSPASPPPLTHEKPTIQTTSNPTGSSAPTSTVHATSTLLTRQDAFTTSMAQNLESLAAHYDQISHALRDYGSSQHEPDSSPTYIVGSAETYKPGFAFSLSPPKDIPIPHARGVDVPSRSEHSRRLADEDMQMFTRDTEELPAILADIEEAASQVNAIHERVRTMLNALTESVSKFAGVMDLLDNLADDMSAKLQEQQLVEASPPAVMTQTYAIHETLEERLTSLDELSQTYLAYHHAYRKLLLEMDRRRRNREMLEELVHDMVEKLDQLRDDEMAQRERFFAEQGQFLPDDLCPFVADRPVRWVVEFEGDETLPHLQESILAEARQQIAQVENVSENHGLP